MQRTSGIVPTYETSFGKCYAASAESFLDSTDIAQYHGQVDLIFTSPPFPLNRKKKYGNKTGQEYADWLSGFGAEFIKLLSESGSIVIELGNAWESGLPVMSTLPLESLIAFKQTSGLFLCQQFIWYNNAKLPSPVQWVNIERCRAKDSYTNIWWFAKTPRPKADNRNVLVEYSKAMKKLLERQSYNTGTRPSEHAIGTKSFLKNNGGAISPNVLIGPNTVSSSAYIDYCRNNDLPIHPTRMPSFLPEFFIRFLTDTDDLVFDPFGGSNVTGEAAEKLNRRWITTEIDPDFVEGSKGRFPEVFGG